jgi:hypothetical protein
MVVTLRPGDGSSRNRRTTSLMPSRGVNVIQIGPCVTLVRVSPSV